MNILLDSMYLMPAIGVAEESVKRDVVKILREKGHQGSVSELTLFELSAKGAKYVASGRLSCERVLDGVRATLHNEWLRKVPFYGREQLVLSFRLREYVKDYIDCAILSSALCGCDAIISEDGLIHSLKKEGKLEEIMGAVNPEFRLLSSRDLNSI